MSNSLRGGIVLSSGAASGSKFAVKPAYANRPVVYVNFLDAFRFVNWLHNGQGSGGTETGAYTLALSGSTILRTSGAAVWMPSEHEWYKAAYHQPASLGGDSDNYWLFPTKSNSEPNSRPPNASDPNSGNFFRDDNSPDDFLNDGYATTGSTLYNPGQQLYVTEVAAYSAAKSFYGTLGQGGNVWEFTDNLSGGPRVLRGGSYLSYPEWLDATHRSGVIPLTYGDEDMGFRVAARIPTTIPTITSGANKTGAANTSFQFQLTASGVSLAASFHANGLPAGLALNSSNGLISGTVTTSGTYPVIVTVRDGCDTGTQTLQLTFTANPGFPVLSGAAQAVLTAGQWFSYTIPPPGNGTGGPVTFTINGQLPAGLSFDSSTGVIAGRYMPVKLLPASDNKTDAVLNSDGSPVEGNQLEGPGGSIVSNVQISATNSFGTDTMQLSFVLAPPPAALNIATRATVGVSDNVLIGGFIVAGDAPKRVIVRAVAPSLSLNAISGAGLLQDPTVALYDPTGALIQQNDDWASDQEEEITATTIAPTNPRESAIIRTLEPGSYTAVVGGKGRDAGIALVEIYDLDSSNGAQLAQISTRGNVQNNDNVLIGGFIIGGDAPVNVLMRGLGPELTDANVPNALQDPTLELHDGNGGVLAFNDNWESDQKQAIIDTTVPPKDSREPAILRSLAAGNYTAIVRGKDNSVGVALVEVYMLK
jgi:hypothetical protein